MDGAPTKDQVWTERESGCSQHNSPAARESGCSLIAANCTMPLTWARIKEIQGDCMADDIDPPDEATAWVESELIEYFESGGNNLPQILGGFEGAEIHAHYEMKQKRMEHNTADDMMEALSAALFKTTGDEQFKVEEKPPEEETVENGYGNVSREKYQFENKYNVPQFGDHNSSTRDIDDTNA